jgi:hypothetical protein
MKTFIVQTQLQVAGAKRGTTATIQPGNPVDLEDESAAPLLACGAIRLSDVVAAAAAAE